MADSGEEEGRPAGGNYTAMDLGNFETGVDRDVDGDNLTFRSKCIQKGTQVWVDCRPPRR